MIVTTKRRRNKDPGRMALAALMAIVYLAVFLAHDVLFCETSLSLSPAKTSDAFSSAETFAAGIKSDLGHHCPFCSGFVDTHSEPVAIWDSIPLFSRTSTPNGHLQSAFDSITHTRGPPTSLA